MKLLYLLTALLGLSAASIALAQEQPSQRAEDFSILPGLNFKSLTDRASQYHLPPNSSNRRDLASSQSAADTVCYTMRSYLVEREDPRSDVTRFAGYKKCLPASKVQLKTTPAAAPNP